MGTSGCPKERISINILINLRNEKINLKSFESDSLVLNDLMSVRGGSGNTSTLIISTSCHGSDHDNGIFDAD